MAATRRRKLIGHRRRVEDEGEDEGPEPLDLDDDSLTEGSASDDHDAANDSDTSNIDDASPTAPNLRKPGNGAAKADRGRPASAQPLDTTSKPISDTEMMLHGLSITDSSEPVREMHFDDISPSPTRSAAAAPIVVSSNPPTRHPSEAPGDRRRREHEEYKRRRDEDPAFVPNRGAFFMHDHRHAGPSANGFRPFGRPRGRGRGGGFGAPFTPIHQLHSTPHDPTISAPWTHDMHDSVANPMPRPPRPDPEAEGPANGNGYIPTCPPNPTPINRTLSSEKHIGNAQIRVYMPEVGIKAPTVFSGVPIKQYTKLPDHRPPLRRDKPIRISLPDKNPRYIFPASDRSFIFIPRALRPNQQRLRGKPRSVFGSMGGYSRGTSVFGGSYYGGSAYSPSIALSRRSSLAPDGRDYMFSPTGSVISRPPMPTEAPRPVVRLPPTGRSDLPGPSMVPLMGHPMVPAAAPLTVVPTAPPTGPFSPVERPDPSTEPSITDLPPPQNHPLPQKPVFHESRPSPLPMHQPRPQKAVSVEHIESPTLMQQAQPYQQAFHQQVPLQVANGYSQEAHTRQPSYPAQHSTGTPLSQIPERAIHAAPFQPNANPNPYSQNFYGQQPYPMMPSQHGFYYPPNFSGSNVPPSATAPAFVPTSQQPQPPAFNASAQVDGPSAQPNGQAPVGPNLVAQEVNGMVYYYDASQLPAVNSFSSFPAPPAFVPGPIGMSGMVTPSPDTFYYPPPAPGMVYYSQ